MADPTTPAEREALRIAAEAADPSRWEIVRCADGHLMVATFGDAIAHQDPNIAPGDAALAANYTHIVAAQPSMILRLLSDLEAAEAQIAEARREGMMEAAGIALDATKAPSQRNMKDQWRAAIGEEVGAVIRAAAPGGRDGDR